MKNRKIFLVLLLVLALIAFTVACSTTNTPNLPNDTVTNSGINNDNNGIGGYENDTVTDGITSGNGIDDNTYR